MSFQDRKKKGDFLGILIITFSFLLFISIGAFILINDSKKIKIDKNTFCPKTGPESKTVAIVDFTDPLNKAQKEFFLKELEKLKNSIKKYHGLIIYFVDENTDLNKSKIFSICNPGTKKDIKTAFEAISIDPKKVEETWEKGFSDKISENITDVIKSSKPQSTSPVMEMFQLVSLREFKDYEKDTNKLIILSDMIQNTSTLSMYKGEVPDFNNFRKTDYFSKVRTNLNKNVNVHLFIIKRDGFRKMQESKKFQSFWSDFFYTGNKSKDIRISYVDG